jgi:[calcium/calmodulin-dependent protein kinase] kinase
VLVPRYDIRPGISYVDSPVPRWLHASLRSANSCAVHAQGIIHRDIKPDNCLITGDDVLKIVDFGVSEMFDKQDQMKTAKSAGSPAFMPPELCVARHGEVDGKAVDIWSMGVTLFCLLFGRIPFERHGVIELYEAIRMDQPEYDECDNHLEDLLRKLLEKDPHKRITMEQIRVRTNMMDAIDVALTV